MKGMNTFYTNFKHIILSFQQIFMHKNSMLFTESWKNERNQNKFIFSECKSKKIINCFILSSHVLNIIRSVMSIYSSHTFRQTFCCLEMRSTRRLMFGQLVSFWLRWFWAVLFPNWPVCMATLSAAVDLSRNHDIWRESAPGKMPFKAIWIWARNKIETVNNRVLWMSRFYWYIVEHYIVYVERRFPQFNVNCYMSVLTSMWRIEKCLSRNLAPVFLNLLSYRLQKMFT